MNFASFKAGCRASIAIIMGMVPFGFVYGALARKGGLSLIETVFMSLTIYAGSAQLVFVDLWESHAGLIVIILACWIINLRMMMYSATIQPHLGTLSLKQALVGSYLLTDESYGICMSRFLRPNFPWSPYSFFMGASLLPWLSWVIASFLGYQLEAIIPKSFPLNLAGPLVFLSLAIPLLSSAPKVTAAIAGSLVAILLYNLPMKLGLLVAIAVGVLVGSLHEKLLRPAND